MTPRELRILQKALVEASHSSASHARMLQVMADAIYEMEFTEPNFTPPPPTVAERGLSKAERRMLYFVLGTVRDYSDKDWQDHGYRQATLVSLESKLRELV